MLANFTLGKKGDFVLIIVNACLFFAGREAKDHKK